MRWELGRFGFAKHLSKITVVVWNLCDLLGVWAFDAGSETGLDCVQVHTMAKAEFGSMSQLTIMPGDNGVVDR